MTTMSGTLTGIAFELGQRRGDGGEGIAGGDIGGARAEFQRDQVVRGEAGQVGLDRGARRRGGVTPASGIAR